MYRDRGNRNGQCGSLAFATSDTQRNRLRPARHSGEFPQQKDFHDWRNTIGGLLLLPKKVNASLNDMAYADKLPHYIKENLLAQSLHPLAYQYHPGFKQAMTGHGPSFKDHPEFKKADLEARKALYCQLAKAVWSVERLKGEVV